MGDVGDFWNDVRAARRAAGLPARQGVRRRSEQPAKRELRAFAEAGFRQRGEWHWQIQIGGDVLDYWPSTDKWRWRGANSQGSFKELQKFISERSG